MKYRVETTPRFEKEFRKLDRYTQRMLKAWIDKNLVDCVDPRAHDKGLTDNRSGQCRYRIGDYRLLCLIEDEELVILAVGMIVAFVVSVLTIKLLMGYIKKHDFKVFGWYRIILGILVLVYFLIFG